MAALPQSNTTRWWAVYVNNNTTHRLGVRTGASVTPAQANTFFNTWFNAHIGLLNSTVVTGLETAVLGSNVRNPVAWTGATSFGTGSEEATDRRPSMISYTGRSADGRKSRIFLFGIKAVGEGDMRIDTTESTVIAAGVTLLNGAAGVYLSISGLQPVWHGYANIGYNDHWTKEYRKG